MKHLFTFLSISILIISCQQKSEFSSDFECPNYSGTSSLKNIKDVNKTYEISIPKHWKTSYYYDEYQSDIYVADTLKSLTSTYILNISNKKGELLVDDLLKQKIETELRNNNFQIVKSNTVNFKNIPSYYIYSKTKSNDYPYQQIQLYIPYQSGYFFDIKIELYGDQLINDRICEAIHYIELLQF